MSQRAKRRGTAKHLARAAVHAGVLACNMCLRVWPLLRKHRLEEQHEWHERRKQRAAGPGGLPTTRAPVPRPEVVLVGLGLSLHVEPWVDGQATDTYNTKRRGCVIVDGVVPGAAAHLGGIQVACPWPMALSAAPAGVLLPSALRPRYLALACLYACL